MDSFAKGGEIRSRSLSAPGRARFDYPTPSSTSEEAPPDEVVERG
ncbi:hypothetical protein [Citricoccus sp. GCM10030269]